MKSTVPKQSSGQVQSRGENASHWSRHVLIWALVAVTAVAVVMLGIDRDEDDPPAISTGDHPFISAQPPVGALPAPWQYDPINDRHWHAEHGHWHPGPPPAGTTPGR